MDDSGCMRRGEAGRDLPRDFGSLRFGKSSDSAQQMREIFALNQLHRDEVLLADLADVVNAADVGMRHLSRQPHLGQEPRDTSFASYHRRCDELQGDLLPELEIFSAVDLPHATAAEARHNAKTVGEQSTRHELFTRFLTGRRLRDCGLLVAVLHLT